jgi:hypothetical protein
MTSVTACLPREAGELSECQGQSGAHAGTPLDRPDGWRGKKVDLTGMVEEIRRATTRLATATPQR